MNIIDIQQSWQLVKTLSQDFTNKQNHYLSSKYNEAEVRKDFIDKLFKAIGWDVDHDTQRDPYQQEVKIEKAEKKAKGRADYAFSIAPHFRRVRFFVEAKSPQKKIDTPDNCFQAIRYSWPKGIAIAVLTDFNSIHIIDSRFRPNINSATSRVVKSWHHSEFLDFNKFSELYYLLSREYVGNGSIENFSQNHLPIPKVATKQYEMFAAEARDFDDDFLDKLDEWREALAIVFKQSRADLNGEQLTECVQRTIDRLVFIRFLEDKSIEPNPIIERFGQNNKTQWHDFIHVSKRLDQIYNGVVFKPHSIIDSPAFELHSTVFADICDELTDQNSPYNFDSIPVEILGRIYERFLGKVVLIKRNAVEVEEKEDVRKAGGVFYTPDYIVAYMVEQSLAAQVASKSAVEIMQLSAIDTACGSGSFLIGVFAYLIQALTAYWRNNPKGAPKNTIETRDGELHLTLQYKRQVLINCIYGVDIDAQAVEVAQLSLYLKLLDEETTYSAQQQQLEIGAALLPSLNQNIVVGNSLITGDLFAFDKLHQLKSLDFKATFPQVFKAGGFDLVIGNPPYIKEGKHSKPFEHIKGSPYYLGKMDIWYMFACRGLDWLKPETGTLALIATNNWVTNAGAKKLREKINQHAQIKQLINFGDYKVFKDAGIQTMILIAAHNHAAMQYSFDYRKLTGIKRTLSDAQALLEKTNQAGCEYLTPTIDRTVKADAPLTFSNNAFEQLLNKIAEKRNFFLDDKKEVAQGIVPNPDVLSAKSLKLISKKRQRENHNLKGQGVFVVESNFFTDPSHAEMQFLKPMFEPTEVKRYFIASDASKKIIYSTKANTLDSPLPTRLIDHLDKFKEVMTERRECKMGRIEHHHLHWPRDEYFFNSGPKILSVRKCAEPTFVYTKSEAYVMMAFNIIKTKRANLLYLTALFNSKLVKFWLKHRGKMQGQMLQVDKEPLLAIPLCLPNKAEQTRIAKLTERLIECQTHIANANTDAERMQYLRIYEQSEQTVQAAINTIYALDENECSMLET